MIVVMMVVVAKVTAAVEMCLLEHIELELSLKNGWDDGIYRSGRICRCHVSYNIDKLVRPDELERGAHSDR